MKRTDLLTALEIVKPGLANKEVVEQSTSFAFMNGSVITYNDHISISHPVEGLTVEGAVRAEELWKFIRKVREDEIELAVTESEIIMRAGKAKAGLVRQAEVKLPLYELTGEKKWKQLPENFIEGVAMAVENCYKSTSQPKINSVHISNGGYIEGTDNWRILRYMVENIPVNTFLLPADSAKEIIKMDLIEIAEGIGWVHFRTGAGTVVSCRIFEDDFPEVSKILEITGDEIVFPDNILHILDKAEIFAQGDNLPGVVEVTIQDKKIVFSSQGEAGWFKESTKTDFEGNIQFMVDPSTFRHILSETKVGIYNKSMLKFQGENWVFVVALYAKKK